MANTYDLWLSFPQLKPGEEMDLTSEYNAIENPVKELFIGFEAVDGQTKMILNTLPELKVCSGKGMSIWTDPL